ncbi:MAG TPA: hypothetical protein PKH77_13410 [Anaerolineae bacterium]|nr:hypothetical protein [Anaerolineae bacterium]
MANPLDPKCQAFALNGAGQVVGVKLAIREVAGARYALKSVTLQDETTGQGTTVANCSVLNRDGINTGLLVRMAWPGPGPFWDASALPGNNDNRHMITNGYNPGVDGQNMGPLALLVGEQSAPESDVLYGLGLPMNRHISFTVVFQERGAVVVDPPADGELLKRVEALEAWRAGVAGFFEEFPR